MGDLRHLGPSRNGLDLRRMKEEASSTGDPGIGLLVSRRFTKLKPSPRPTYVLGAPKDPKDEQL